MLGRKPVSIVGISPASPWTTQVSNSVKCAVANETRPATASTSRTPTGKYRR